MCSLQNIGEDCLPAVRERRGERKRTGDGLFGQERAKKKLHQQQQQQCEDLAFLSLGETGLLEFQSSLPEESTAAAPLLSSYS